MLLRRDMARWAVALAMCLIGPIATHAQSPVDTSGVEADLEAILDELDLDARSAAQLAETLTDLAAHPLDLNSASAATLSQIPLITPSLASQIVAHRDAQGPFGAVSDLIRLPGIGAETVRRIRPYVQVLPTASATGSSGRLREWMRDLDVEVIQRVTRRLDLSRRYDPAQSSSPFLGSPERLYTRLRVRSERLRLGLTLDKDPGEAFRWDPSTQTYGYDHATGHIALMNRGRMERLIVGDFSAEFGQGLTLWRRMAFGKGRDPVSPLVRSGRGLVPYGSTEENRFFRGLAATVRVHRRVAVSAFASRRTLDATLTPPADSDSAEALLLITSEPETGLHRTAAEQARKDASRETAIGGAVEYQRAALQAGAVGYRSVLAHPLDAGLRPDEQFDWTGTHRSMWSAYANASLGRYHVFGEVGRAPGGTWGGVGGLSMELSPHVDALLLGRYYPRTFNSRHGYAFGERNGATQNEMGLYAGLRLRLSDRWAVSASFDQYRFPWLRFATPRPTAGYDARLVLDHRPRRWLRHYLQFRTETRETAASVQASPVQELEAVRPETRQSLRWHGRYEFSDQLRLQSRVELSRFAPPTSGARTGVLLYQDVRWHPISSLRIDARIAFFDTDGFDARIYTYENDLLYAFALPVLSGRGQRRYLLGHLDIGKGLDLQFKFSVTQFNDTASHSAGPSLRREIRAQLRWTR